MQTKNPALLWSKWEMWHLLDHMISLWNHGPIRIYAYMICVCLWCLYLFFYFECVYVFIYTYYIYLIYIYIYIYLWSCMSTLCPPSPLQLRQCGGFSPLGDGCTVRSSNVGEPFCGHQWRSKHPGWNCKSRIYPLSSSSSSSSSWSSPSAHVGHITINITYHYDYETNIIITMIMMFLVVNSCFTWVWTSMHIINIILTIILIIHIFPLLWYLCGIFIYIYTHVFLFFGKAYIHLFRPLLVHPLQISQKKHPTHLRVTASSQGSDGIWPTALAAAMAGPALSMLSFNELVAACERMVPSKNGGQGG